MEGNTLRLVSCPNCGYKVELGMSICPNCGYPLRPVANILSTSKTTTKSQNKKSERKVVDKKYEDEHMILEYLLDNEVKQLYGKVLRAEKNIKIDKIKVPFYFETENKIDFIYVYKLGLLNELGKIISTAEKVSLTERKPVNIVIIFEKRKEKIEQKIQFYKKKLEENKKSVTIQTYYYSSFIANEAED